jgi:aryl-alcohol dehydrogenase-like predicted oxidoreductase
MRTRPLGPTGWNVSAIGLGAMPLSVPDNRPGERDAIGVIHRAVAVGITFIDTADSYCIDDREAGHNERLIGQALTELGAADRQRIVVATKGGIVRPGGRWELDGRPQHLRRACEQSLRNLRVETISLYQLHAPDATVPLAESLGELKRLRDEGKIRHIGVSNFSQAQIEQAMADPGIVSVQNRWSSAHRQPEADGTLSAAMSFGLAFLPWSPLGGMRSAKRLGAGQGVVQRLAKLRAVSPQRLALAWMLAKAPHVIPIPGASRRESVEDSAAAAELELAPEEVERLDRAWV